MLAAAPAMASAQASLKVEGTEFVLTTAEAPSRPGSVHGRERDARSSRASVQPIGGAMIRRGSKQVSVDGAARYPERPDMRQ
jgi:hypothetical protein